MDEIERLLNERIRVWAVSAKRLTDKIKEQDVLICTLKNEVSFWKCAAQDAGEV